MRQSNYSLMSVIFLFDGRATRLQWWIVFSASVIAGLVAIQVDKSFGYKAEGPTFVLLWLLLTWPNLAVSINRWHDRDKSGFWVFINFVPVIGQAWAFIENGFLQGTPGPNRFGPSPRKETKR